MLHALIGVVLGVLICAGPVPGRPEKDPPKDKTGVPSEKTDAKVDRSLTGIVEKVEVKDEEGGTLTMRSSGPPQANAYRYLFRIDAKTKILTAKGEPLEDGLKSRQLAGAEVRVVFVDRRPGADKPAAPDFHLARTVQLIRPGK